MPKNAAEVVVATYGRGVWILRDVWQLEMDAQAASPAAQNFQLLKPLPGIRRASAERLSSCSSFRRRPHPR